MDQLKLALTWNRVDVAEEKIFTPDTDWPVSEKGLECINFDVVTCNEQIAGNY